MNNVVNVSFPKLYLIDVNVWDAVNASYYPPVVSSVSPSSGSTIGGFNVTLTGYNFGGEDFGPKVYFSNDYECDLTEWISDTSVKCVSVPEGAGYPTVKVFVGGQWSYDSGGEYFIYSAPTVIGFELIVVCHSVL